MQNVKPISMGLGKLGNPDIILVREFRWTLEAPGLDKSFIQSVEFDFVHCVVKFSAYEAATQGNPEIQLQSWLEKPIGPMTFTTYDGCGNPIYEYKLERLEKMADGIIFDYSSSQVARRKVTIAYGSLKKTSLFTEQKDECCEVVDRKRRDARGSRKHPKTYRRTKATKRRS